MTAIVPSWSKRPPEKTWMDFTKSFKPSSSDMDNFPKIFRSPTSDILDTKKENPMAFFTDQKQWFSYTTLHHKLEQSPILPKDTQFAIARSHRDFRTSLLALPLDPKMSLVCSIHWQMNGKSQAKRLLQWLWNCCKQCDKMVERPRSRVSVLRYAGSWGRGKPLICTFQIAFPQPESWWILSPLESQQTLIWDLRSLG